MRNVAEQGAYGHQRHTPPIGRQGPPERAPGALYGAADGKCGIDDTQEIPVIVYDGGGVEVTELAKEIR